MADTSPSTDLATTPPQTPDVPATAWPTSQHLSPLAAFEPNRVEICTEHQMQLIDAQATPASAHIAAARRHIQAALTAGGNLDRDYLRETVARLERHADRARH